MCCLPLFIIYANLDMIWMRKKRRGLYENVYMLWKYVDGFGCVD